MSSRDTVHPCHPRLRPKWCSFLEALALTSTVLEQHGDQTSTDGSLITAREAEKVVRQSWLYWPGSTPSTMAIQTQPSFPTDMARLLHTHVYSTARNVRPSVRCFMCVEWHVRNVVVCSLQPCTCCNLINCLTCADNIHVALYNPCKHPRSSGALHLKPFLVLRTHIPTHVCE